MHGHNVRPGQQFGSQKLKFTGHLSDDRLLFAGLQVEGCVAVKTVTVVHVILESRSFRSGFVLFLFACHPKLDAGTAL